MQVRKLIAGAAAGAAIFVLAEAPAGATHVHSRQVGNGRCVLMAQKGGEKNVQLPFATEHAANRRHPLHVLVHLGRPGERQRIGVYDDPRSDPCFASQDYLNRR
jgi:hypothetical protein